MRRIACFSGLEAWLAGQAFAANAVRLPVRLLGLWLGPSRAHVKSGQLAGNVNNRETDLLTPPWLVEHDTGRVNDALAHIDSSPEEARPSWLKPQPAMRIGRGPAACSLHPNIAGQAPLPSRSMTSSRWQGAHHETPQKASGGGL
ncbi:hypothetical protein Micbo1qcDRAFT_173006 [Microdochium bolleyi]|uniref:Uncharacterized protein n=1 Tax=Microdochium bolleyi TaxID=196109 RepID=A0A136JAH6_9PEZI|nr:hypothetical protein Micbo1qcDRAFT_173006 [Microdochium bolleyi]